MLIGEQALARWKVWRAHGLGDVPSTLRDRELIELDMSRAGGWARKYPRQVRTVSERRKGSQQRPAVVLSSSLMTAYHCGRRCHRGFHRCGQHLKPALAARGELRGATTLDEYRKYIEKDAALARRFQTRVGFRAVHEDTISICVV